MKPDATLPTTNLSRRSLLASCSVLAPAMFFHSASAFAAALASANSFTVKGNHFLLNGKPFQVIAGEMHYARIPREYWKHRIQMAKAMGLNTIATYVFWNVHEPRVGEYNFDGQYDLVAFLRAIQAEGMHVLLRAGPYSCAEWEFGGFPAWLLKDPRMKTALRTNDDAFMVPVARWIARLAQETVPLLIANGGPILAVQVENEYGNFGNEKPYMEHMLRIFQSTGYKNALLYTVDPSKALEHGMLNGILSGVNFGTGNAEHGLAAEAALRPGQPLFATEYWPGWFDLWGHPHETRPLAPQLKDLEYILSHGASLNIYMFHGGTSFGMMAGASASTGNYRGNVTSYDYDAPLDEAGHPTPKFHAYRDLILKHTGGKALPLPAVPEIIAIPEFMLNVVTPYDGRLESAERLKPVVSETPLTMEQVDQAFGYILYRTHLNAAANGEPLIIDPVHDYAQVYLDGKLVGTLDRHYNQTTLTLKSDKPSRLDILVENTGRLNSTKDMRNEWKGIQSATLSGQPLTGWKIYSLPWSTPPELYDAAPYIDPGRGPHIAGGDFMLDKTGDAFLDVSALGKGVIWINGHALGRFWNIGPQQTLYVPAPWLVKGQNAVVVFDMLPVPGLEKLISGGPLKLLSPVKPQTLMGRLKPILDGPTPTYADDPERKKKADDDAEFGPKLAAPESPSTLLKE